MSRTLLLAAAASTLVACGGASFPLHNGYKQKNATPWLKPKELKLNEKMEGKVDGDLDYKDFRRAKWYVINLPHDGDLSINLEVTPPGEDKFDLALEVLDPNFHVMTKSDKDDDDGYELKKSKSLIELKQGAYLVHLYLEGRMDTCEYELSAKFTPGQLAGEDTFPRDVAFYPALPVVPLQDDTPVTTKPEHTGGGHGHGHVTTGGNTPPPPPPPPGTGPVSGKVIDVKVAGTGTQITINRGTDHGLKDGSKGVVDGVKGGGFTTFGCGPRSCKANVGANADAVNASGKVTVNP